MPKITNDLLVSRFLRQYGDDLLFVVNEDRVYRYNEGVYTLLDRADLSRLVYSFVLKQKDAASALIEHPEDEEVAATFNVTANLVKSLVEEIKFSLTRRAYEPLGNFITFADNTVLDLDGFLRGNSLETSLIPWSRSTLSFFKLEGVTSLDVTSQDCPAFTAFLQDVLVTSEDDFTPDPDLIDFMQQLLGYILLPTLKAEAAFFLVGTTAANGKSILLHIIHELIGKEYVSALPLSALTSSRFSLPYLIGKKLNMKGEEEAKFLTGELFKQLISGDPVTGEVKFGEQVTFINRAKFLFATNDVPTFKQLDAGILRRLFFIPFFRSFRDDPNAKDRDVLITAILAERPGIIRFALVGAQKLMRNNFRFVRTSSMLTMNEEFETASSSALAFIKEHYQITGNHNDIIWSSTLYDAYTEWCEKNGHSAQAHVRFSKELTDCYKRQGLGSARAYDSFNKKQIRTRTGIRSLADT